MAQTTAKVKLHSMGQVESICEDYSSIRELEELGEKNQVSSKRKRVSSFNPNFNNPIRKPKALKLLTTDEVAELVLAEYSDTPLQSLKAICADEEIDGEVLVCMEKEDLRAAFKLPFGRVVKLYKRLKSGGPAAYHSHLKQNGQNPINGTLIANPSTSEKCTDDSNQEGRDLLSFKPIAKQSNAIPNEQAVKLGETKQEKCVYKTKGNCTKTEDSCTSTLKKYEFPKEKTNGGTKSKKKEEEVSVSIEQSDVTKTSNSDIDEISDSDDSFFISSRNFQGQAGYEFKYGKKGLGYYKAGSSDDTLTSDSDSEEMSDSDIEEMSDSDIEEMSDSDDPSFISSESFQGGKAGYEFKLGKKGLGYYKAGLSDDILTSDSESEELSDLSDSDIEEVSSLMDSSTFISSESFQGGKAGYEFKLGKKGLGYYKAVTTFRSMNSESVQDSACLIQEQELDKGIHKKVTATLSGYRGVKKVGHANWQAQIYIDKKQIRLGKFSNAVDAAKAYDAAARKHQKYPRLNFPTSEEKSKGKKPKSTIERKGLKVEKEGTKDLDYVPRPGYVSKQKKWYSALEDETLVLIANKLGCEWREIAELPENTSRYNNISANARLRKDTLLKIPKSYSKWKIKDLVEIDPKDHKYANPIECVVCKVIEEGDEIDMLLCDGCDAGCHLPCSGFNTVPEDDWFCSECTDVLTIRRLHSSYKEKESIIPKRLPPLRKLRRLSKLCWNGDESRSMDELSLKRDNMIKERYSKELKELENLAVTSHVTNYQSERQAINLKYGKLLKLPQFDFESDQSYRKRQHYRVRLLGYVTPLSKEDVLAMTMLTEPEELILFVESGINQDVDEKSDHCQADDRENSMYEFNARHRYAVFATPELFDINRDDQLAIDFEGLRGAQKRLMSLLIQNKLNKKVIVQSPAVPSSVRTRDNAAAKLFDLSELVRDCNVELDLPQKKTPQKMAENGLQLHEFQMSSLRWLLDKEKCGESDMGLASEFWYRLRFYEDSNDDYFYCELTGSIVSNIFDFQGDVQGDASPNTISMPNGGILGEEMGLGKTLICLALIVSNPPPKRRLVLPREYIWALEKHEVKHPLYRHLPRIGKEKSSQSHLLTNGTLVIAPMTLMSQWSAEIERYAPHLTILNLHNTELLNVYKIASTDVVVASTWLIQQSGRGTTASFMFNKVRMIHWHRIIVDESHYNQVGTKTKEALAQLSATHRHCVTGTPVGHSLDDLYGQLRFLRIAPFHRKTFWDNAISSGYYSHNKSSLQVLQRLLSHVVVRHSKEQTLKNGKAIVSLPPRKVETVLMEFGSKPEKELYHLIQDRNKELFLSLKKKGEVMSHYMSLLGMIVPLRQMCSHPSQIDVYKLDKANRFFARDFWGKAKLNNERAETRASLLQRAIKNARPMAETRVREVLSKFQGVDCFMECPVCFEATGENMITILPCAHPICGDCVLNIMEATSTTRGPRGVCPQCRDHFYKSETTFLGDAKDILSVQVSQNNESKNTKESQLEPHLIANKNAFQVEVMNVQISVHGSDTLRAGRQIVEASAEERERRLLFDIAQLPTLSTKFLSTFDLCEKIIGTKICRLLQELDHMFRNDPCSKAVVFSQFLTTLDVVAEELTARGIAYRKITGNSKQHERADALIDFSADRNIRVFLLSMRSGSVGLTLTAADHCFLMDPAQNAAVEEQAIDRIHRIGQSKPVYVKRFVMQGTVEERILKVRRSVGADRTTTGTNVSGITEVEDDEPVRAQENNSSRKHKRLQDLTHLFDCDSNNVSPAPILKV